MPDDDVHLRCRDCRMTMEPMRDKCPECGSTDLARVRHYALYIDDGGYYIELGDDELGPINEEELRGILNSLATEFGASGEY